MVRDLRSFTLCDMPVCSKHTHGSKAIVMMEEDSAGDSPVFLINEVQPEPTLSDV